VANLNSGVYSVRIQTETGAISTNINVLK
jgi:hypothetical protein